MAKTPTWATELIERVCSECERPVPPVVQWQRGTRRGYSGRAWSGKKIHIRVGPKTPRWEQKLVVLHELAHYMLPTGEHHNERFWTLAFLFYRRYGVPVRKALANERTYRLTAVAGYKRSLELVKAASPSSSSPEMSEGR